MARAELCGQLVDVINGKIAPSRVITEDGRISEVIPMADAPSRFILPGLIDAHVHIESSLLCPSRFAEAAVPHGTTATVSDPHEIANVMGMAGIAYMLLDAEGVPLRFHFTAPSCVPATRFETSGAIIGVKEIESMLEDRRFVGLGEVMDYRGVIADDPDMIMKIKATKKYWKKVDGHCPGLIGRPLVKYINAGISSDHECTTSDEAEEKYFLGMWIQVREGSASRDMARLMPFAKANECMLVTDDLRAKDLENGHVDGLLRKAVALGMDPMHAIRAVTSWPAWHYGLPGGSIVVGRTADMVVVDDLKDFRVLEVYISGELVAKDGRPLFPVEPKRTVMAMVQQDRTADEMFIPASGEKAAVRVLEVYPDRIDSGCLLTEVPVVDGRVQADVRQDVLLLALADRYAPRPLVLGLIKGFGLRSGAMASSVAHDSHHIIAVGASAEDMAKAINAVSRSGGFAVSDGDRLEQLPLDVAGLMSSSPIGTVSAQETKLLDVLKDMGCVLPAPFSTLSFQSLLVVPELKISNFGLFDSLNGRFVSPLL